MNVPPRPLPPKPRKAFELLEEERHAPISKEIAESCRHKYEKALYVLLVIINVLVILYALVVVFVELIFGAINFYLFCTQDEPEYMQSDLGGSKLVMYGILIFVMAIISLYLNYANYRSNAIRITPNNFPEVYQMIEEYSHRLGIKVPKAYVMQSSGVLNAFAAYIFKGQWIQINSEVMEVAYREYHDMNALRFIVAHEISHIYFKHATFSYWFFMCFVNTIPIISPLASRSREFSCDRLAQRLTGLDGVDSMLLLTVDRHLYRMIDKNDYVNEIIHQKGFFVWLVNLLSTHPVMTKRIDALLAGRGSGKLF